VKKVEKEKEKVKTESPTSLPISQFNLGLTEFGLEYHVCLGVRVLLQAGIKIKSLAFFKMEKKEIFE